MSSLEFDFTRFNIGHDSELCKEITILTETNQTLLHEVQELTKENEILKQRLLSQNNNDGNECMRIIFNPESAIQMVLIDSHFSFGGHDMRNIIFNFLSKDDYKSLFEVCKAINVSMKIICPDLTSTKNKKPSIAHIFNLH